MQPKSIKKIWQQNLHKIYLPKIHHFIAELLMILEADLQQVQQKLLQNADHHLAVQTLNSEKKAIIETLSRVVDLIVKLNKFIYADTDEALEKLMIDDDKKIIDAFVSKILAKNPYAK